MLSSKIKELISRRRWIERKIDELEPQDCLAKFDLMRAYAVVTSQLADMGVILLDCDGLPAMQCRGS